MNERLDFRWEAFGVHEEPHLFLQDELVALDVELESLATAQQLALLLDDCFDAGCAGTDAAIVGVLGFDVEFALGGMLGRHG